MKIAEMMELIDKTYIKLMDFSRMMQQYDTENFERQDKRKCITMLLELEKYFIDLPIDLSYKWQELYRKCMQCVFMGKIPTKRK